MKVAIQVFATGKFPRKLFIFDREVVLSALVRRSGHPAALLVRHAPYARAMGILFEFLWNQGKPLVIEGQTAASTASKTSARTVPETDQASQRISRNGRSARATASPNDPLKT